MSHPPGDAFLDALDDLFLVFDESGAVIEWNQAVLEVTGRSCDEITELTADAFFAAADADRIDAMIATVLRTGEATIEADIVAADGRHVPYEFNAHRVSMDGSLAIASLGRHSSERIRQRERIEARERALRDMYEIIADRDLEFTEQVEALLRLGRDELEVAYGTLSRIDGADYVFEVVDADDDSIQAGDVVPLSATNCELAASDEKTLVLGDVERDAPDQTHRAGYADWGISCYVGAPVYVDDEVYGTFCFYDTEPRDGQFSEWEVALVDLLSQWVSYELQRERFTDRLQRQNDRLERFTSIVSHDLRNPLNVVSGSIELAAETGDLEQLSRARRAVDRMDTLIEDLLLLARSGDVIDETERVDLGALAADCWQTVLTDDATLSVGAERTVQADRRRLQQLLESLFRNAVEHGSTSPRSQTHEDAVEQSSTSPRSHARGDSVEHGSTDPHSQTREDAVEHDEDATQHGGRPITITVGDLPNGFYVEDDGTGIPEEIRADVFESGYTTIEGGTGFGLAIVSEIADAHGWEIDVTESEAGGARFEITDR